MWNIIENKKMLFEFNSRNLNVDYADLKLINLFNRWTESNHVKNIKTEETFYRYSTDFKSIFEDNFVRLLWKRYENTKDKYSAMLFYSRMRSAD